MKALSNPVTQGSSILAIVAAAVFWAPGCASTNPPDADKPPDVDRAPVADKSTAAAHPGLGTIVLFTAQTERAASFYSDSLGLGEPTFRKPGHAGWQLGGVYFAVEQSQPDAAASAGCERLVPWFEVNDLDATYNRLVQDGAVAVRPPAPTSWGPRLARVRDPDGNIIGLSQRRAAK